MLKYPYSQPWVTQDDRNAVARVLNGTMLTRGEETTLFERELEARFSVAHAIVCNSGTAALHLAYMAIGLGPNKRLLTSPVTFLATANAAKMVEAEVSFCDVDSMTALMTPETLRAALESVDGPVDAIAPVHLSGRACDMPVIKEIADEYGCKIIEDASHSPGAVYTDAQGGDHVVGACRHSNALIFSFHAIKHISMGEGGALLTNDSVIAEKARLLRNHGMSRNPHDWLNAPEPNAPWYYEMQELGWNYHAPDILCAFGRSQLERLDEGVARRAHIAGLYEKLLGGVEHITLPPSMPHGYRHVWHLYPLAVNFIAIGMTRTEVMNKLAAKGVGTQVHYIPLYHHPYYHKEGFKLSGVETYYANTLSIPIYPGMTDEDVSDISNAIKSIICKRGND